MSNLLPQKIPPQGEKLIDARGNMSTNWWLFFYHIAQQTLGGQPDASGLLILLSETLDSDVVESPVQSQFVPDVELPSANLLDYSALLLPDVPPANRALAETASTAGASPYVYTAAADGMLLITGGTVSLIEIARSGTYYTVGLTAGPVPVARLDKVRITHTVAPTVVFFPGST